MCVDLFSLDVANMSFATLVLFPPRVAPPKGFCRAPHPFEHKVPRASPRLELERLSPPSDAIGRHALDPVLNINNTLTRNVFIMAPKYEWQQRKRPVAAGNKQGPVTTSRTMFRECSPWEFSSMKGRDEGPLSFKLYYPLSFLFLMLVALAPSWYGTL